MKNRDSNLECLRIIAMFLVLVLHATFIGTGIPHTNDVFLHPFLSFCRFSSGAFSIICVNLFVMISGWFGIHFKFSKLSLFLFTAIFYALFVYSILLILFPSKYFNWAAASTILMLNPSDYWFVKSYIILYILSPILNAFIEHNDERKIRTTLIVFYSIQTVYAWLSINGAADFQGGYSALSFIGLYLLAQYFHRYPGVIKTWSAKQGFCIFGGIALFNSTIAFIVTYLGLPIAGRIFTYTNPLVIIQTLALLIGFSKLSFQSKFINWIASSCFAVYLLHANELILRVYFGATIRNWFLHESYIVFTYYTFLLISCIFIVSILIDKLRIQLFRLIRL